MCVCVCVFSDIYIYIYTETKMDQSAGAAEYNNYISAGGYDLPNEYPGYDTKQSAGEASVILKLRGVQSTPTLPSLPGPFCPEVVALHRVLSMGQIELNLC